MDTVYKAIRLLSVVGLFTLSIVEVENCQTESHTIDLGQDAPPPSKDLAYRPDNTNLLFVCKGEGFENKTWQTSGLLSGVKSSYSDNDGGLVIEVSCGERASCQAFTLTCSGTRVSSSTLLSVHTHLSPDCGIGDSTEGESIIVTSAAASSQQVEKHALIGKHVPYFGIILGFSICVGLAVISCLVVFMQRQCNTKSWARHCHCLSTSNSKGHSEMENQMHRNSHHQQDRHGPIPLMRFAQMRKGSQQQNQKMGTLHEV